jgi:hypothetical protein
MIFDWFQRSTYEATAFLGPITSALLAGFAVVILGDLYLTPAGERHLAQIDSEAA